MKPPGLWAGGEHQWEHARPGHGASRGTLLENFPFGMREPFTLNKGDAPSASSLMTDGLEEGLLMAIKTLGPPDRHRQPWFLQSASCRTAARRDSYSSLSTCQWVGGGGGDFSEYRRCFRLLPVLNTRGPQVYCLSSQVHFYSSMRTSLLRLLHSFSLIH